MSWGRSAGRGYAGAGGVKGTVAVGSVLLVLLGCLVGVVIAEAGFRAYVYLRYPQMFHPDRSIVAYDVSHWEFDERFGYVYPPERVIHQTNVEDGRVRSCQRVDVINRDGNIGPIIGNYHQAEVKVLVFGDSWAAFHQDGRTWPAFLQDVLHARLDKAVHVVNFGRDGYGILQMFDLAAAKIVEWKPDLVLFAFISDDLTRARFWRTVVGDGDDARVLTTREPVPNPDVRAAADTFLLMPSATYEWCRRAAATRSTDAVLERLIQKHHVLLEHNNPTRGGTTTVLSLRHSFLYNRVARGDAFAFRLSPAVNPRVPYRSYADDPGFVRSLERVNAAGVPWALFHLAYYPEIKAGKEYNLARQQKALLDSLETITGRTVLRTTDYIEMPVPQAERMNAAPDNFHPSRWGMELYAKAVAEALVRNGLLRRAGQR
jgi:lysophospholipase L1-like esterase